MKVISVLQSGGVTPVQTDVPAVTSVQPPQVTGKQWGDSGGFSLLNKDPVSPAAVCSPRWNACYHILQLSIDP